MMLGYLLLACGAMYWFQAEIKQFPLNVHRQIYHDVHSLSPLPFSLAQFMAQSALQSKAIPTSLLLIFPFSSVIFATQPFWLFCMILILLYLALLDYCYYLTDIRYIAILFMLSLSALVFIQPNELAENIATLLFSLIFFALLSLGIRYFTEKEALGSGDILLLISLSPLYSTTQFTQLLLIASVAGLLFSGSYFCLKRQKLPKLPFIPFIALAFCCHLPSQFIST